MTARRRALQSMSVSYQPPFPPGDNRPRSTPIPGHAFVAPAMQEPVPPTVGAFLGNDAPTPPVFVASRRRRSWGSTIISLIIVGGIAAGIAPAVIGVMKARESVSKAIQQSNDLSNPNLSNNDLASLGLTGNEQTLFQGGAPSAVAASLDNAAPGQPTMFLRMLLYPDYAFATAQNSTLPDHFDEYHWRSGRIGTPSPQDNDAEAANEVFSIDQVNWAGLSSLVADAVNVSEVEQGTVTHVSIGRDTFSADLPVVIRVYVDGPRSSAYVEADANGTVIAIH